MYCSKRGSSIILRALLLTLLMVAVSTQASVLDQNNQPLNLYMNSFFEWQQQITVGTGGQLSGITLYSNSGNDTVKIGVGPGFFHGTYSFITTVPIKSGGTFVDTSSAAIFLHPGDFFVIDVQGAGTLLGSSKRYSGGDLYLNDYGTIIDDTQLYGYSMAFQTYMNPHPVPEPGSLMLLGTAVLRLTGVLRRKIHV